MKYKLYLLGLTFMYSTSVVNSQTNLPESPHFHISELSEGIYAAIHNDDGGAAICNAGIIDLGDQTIIIDPFLTPKAAQDLKAAAKSLTGRETSMIINTHYHNDHTRGNQVFASGTPIIATPFTRAHLEQTFYRQIAQERKSTPAIIQQLKLDLEHAQGQERSELKLWIDYYTHKLESLDELKLVLPNLTVSDSLTIHGSQRNLKLYAMGRGHTGGDLIAFLPESKIIFMGDLLFNERHPFMGDGDPETWIQHLNLVDKKLHPMIAVPGHGPIGDRTSILIFRQYIQTISTLIDQAIDDNTSNEDLSSIAVPAAYTSWLLSRFYPINLQILVQQRKNSPKKN